MTDAVHPQERTAREHYHDAIFALRDGAGAAHFWSRYHQAVVVIEAGETATVELPVTYADGHTIETLGDWLEYTRAERGVEHDRIDASMADTFTRAVQP